MRALLAVLLLVISLQVARADSNTREEATRIMESAIETHESGDYLAALDGFNKAYFNGDGVLDLVTAESGTGGRSGFF